MIDFRHMSVRKRIQYLAVLGCLISGLLFCLFTIPALRRNIHNTQDNSYRIVLNAVGEQLESSLMEMHRTAASLTCSYSPGDQVSRYLFSGDILEKTSIRENVSSQLVLHDFTSSVIGTVAYYLPGEPDMAFISNNPLYAFRASSGHPFFTQIPFSVFSAPHSSVTTNNSLVFSLSRYAGTVQDRDYYLYMETDPEFFRDLLSQLRDEAGNPLPLCLTDAQGSVVYTTGETPVKVGDLLQPDTALSRYKLFSYNTENWNIILCIPGADYNHLLFSSIRGYLLTLICFLAVYAVLTHWIYRTAYKPLDCFVKELSDYGLSGIYQSNVWHSQEFDEYYLKIEQMKQKICDLIGEVENESRQNAYLENQLLRSRINPHFLHNTLAGICEQAKASGQDELAHTIQALNNLLYHNLGKSKITTLQDELNAVDDYILLQHRVREFSYRTDIQVGSDLLSMEMPSFILQPLVENSFIHSHAETLEIVLRVRREGNALLIELEDNGKGMLPGRQDEVTSLLNQPTAQGMGIGLGYVNSTLKYFFAQNASLTVQNANGHSGFLATIVINL